MSLSQKNGMAFSGLSAIDGVTSISAYNGIAASFGGSVPTPAYQWDFNENTGTTATDSIASATLSLNPPESTWGFPHKGASAIAFTGTGANNISGIDRLNQYRAGQFSISLWVYPTSLTINPAIFLNGAGFQLSGCYIQVTSTGAVIFATNQSGAIQTSNTSTSVVPTGTWTHICITRSLAVVKIYINGSDATTVSGTHVNPDATSGSMQLGDYSGDTLKLAGNIDQFYIYSIALTAPQVAQIYINTQ